MKNETIHFRINLMLLGIGLIFLILLLTLFVTTYNQEKLILKESKLQFQNEAISLTANKTELLKQVAYDYTFWNEFLERINVKKDTAWYSNNITTILKSFRVDYVSVYDTSYQLVHEISMPYVKSKGFISKETLDSLNKKRLMNFFQLTPEGLFEIAAASVHPDSDPSHMLTRPSGYLFVSKILNVDYLSRLSILSGAEVSLILQPETIETENDLVTTASLPVYDLKKQVIARILFKRTSTILKLYRQISIFMFLTLFISIIITWLIFNFTIKKWVTKPLKLVTKILETGNNSLINELRQCPGEFRQIGTLFSDFVDQKFELKNAKEKAEESDRLKSSFLANMSHEIRTPMSGILGFVELLKEPVLSGEEHQKYISIIEESGKRMLNVINDIVSISKIEAGQAEINPSETNINDQIKFTYSFFKPEASKKGIDLFFKTDLSDSEAIIETDREKIYAIFTNLVKNAIKFTDRGFVEFGYERVETHGRASLLQFYVRDTGVGIRSNQQEIIFERFRQASESLSRNYEGAGLGLAISKAYVEMLGGKIWVESELGKGSIFYFTIPFTQYFSGLTVPEKPVSLNREISNVSGLTILLAEDDEVSIMLIGKLIRTIGKEIIKVRTGLAAIEACKDNPDIDLVLMDIQMPEMDGYEATRQIRKFNKDVIIIAQTALGAKGEKARALAEGCNDYLSKPIAASDFAELIWKYFEIKI